MAEISKEEAFGAPYRESVLNFRQQFDDAFVSQLLGKYAQNADAENVFQLMLQQHNRDVDWQRTNPVAIANMLQSMGMSRSAALAAAAGVQGATTGVGSFSYKDDAAQLTNDIANVNAAVQAAAQNAYNLVQLPYDNRVKYATAQLMTAQGTMLSEQRDGQALAAAAIQAAANSGYTFDNASASDVLQFLQNQPYTAEMIKQIQSNPYAYSSLTALCSADYATRAASFDPSIAAANLKQQNALTVLSQNDANNIELNNTLLSNQVYKDNIVTALSQAVEYAQANYSIKLSETESARLQNILEHIRTFNEMDLAIVHKELNDAKMMNDPSLRNAMLADLTASSRYNAMLALYGFAKTDLLYNQFKDEKTFDPQRLNKAAEKYLYGVDLGGYERQNNMRGWFTGTAGVIGSVAGAWLIGSKILSPKVLTPPMLQGFSPQQNLSFSRFNQLQRTQGWVVQ